MAHFVSNRCHTRVESSPIVRVEFAHAFVLGGPCSSGTRWSRAARTSGRSPSEKIDIDCAFKAELAELNRQIDELMKRTEGAS
jgi:hypothetical protein